MRVKLNNSEINVNHVKMYLQRGGYESLEQLHLLP